MLTIISIIKSTVLTQMAESKLEVSKLTGLATDGVSVMAGKRNGIASKLCEESKLLLSVHCNNGNDDVAYIKTVEKKYSYSCGHYFIQQKRRLLMQKLL